jgi:Tfp pilus assembly protein FimT
MSVNEELSEHSHGAHNPFDKRVAVTMAIIAALLAIVSVAGHRASNEELLAQQKASDQWAFYQAKDIRRYDSEIAQDFLQALKADGTEERRKHYKDNAVRYDKDRADIQKEAQTLEAERDVKGKQARSLEFGEIFLEIGIVFASLAILTKQPLVWYGSLATAAAGVVIAATTGLIH